MTLRRSPGVDTAAATIALASWFQFGPNEKVLHVRLQSRMFLWCLLGRGRLRIDGTWRDFAPNDWVLLPWGPEVLYHADSEEPCLVGSIHLLPFHDPKRKLEFFVPTQKGHAFFGASWRRDVPWPPLTGLIEGRREASDPLFLLGSYIIKRFQRGQRGAAELRNLAALLVDEIVRASRPDEGGAAPIPAELRRIQEFARSHLTRQMTVADLARVAGCSQPTVHRLFRDFLHTTPYRWLCRLRIGHAEELLRATRDPIADLGARVGFPDPFHFSRFFKRHAGISPRLFRQGTRRF